MDHPQSMDGLGHLRRHRRAHVEQAVAVLLFTADDDPFASQRTDDRIDQPGKLASHLGIGAQNDVDGQSHVLKSSRKCQGCQVGINPL